MVEILRKELEQMIIDGYPYSEILKKSQELDKHIAVKFRKMNKKIY